MKSVEKAIDIMMILIMLMLTVKFILIPVRTKIIDSANQKQEIINNLKGVGENEITITGTNIFNEISTNK